MQLQLFEFFTQHDLLRLQKYSQQLADLPLITDLIPRLCTLYFGRRMGPFRLSFLQEAALFALGAQRKSRKAGFAFSCIGVLTLLSIMETWDVVVGTSRSIDSAADVVAAELSVPVNQILALFNKATVKCHQSLRVSRFSKIRENT